MKKRSKKPTETFGWVAFGKDGTVRPELQRLPGDAPGQELGVANRFVQLGSKWTSANVTIKQLPQSDHDFALISSNGAITEVQCVEIVYHDFLLPRGSAATESIVRNGELWGIDSEKRDCVIAEKIRLKLGKHYSKGKTAKLWLLVWSVTGYQFGNFVTGGKSCISHPIAIATDFVKQHGPGPFDRIFFFNMLTRPNLIWPA